MMSRETKHIKVSPKITDVSMQKRGRELSEAGLHLSRDDKAADVDPDVEAATAEENAALLHDAIFTKSKKTKEESVKESQDDTQGSSLTITLIIVAFAIIVVGLVVLIIWLITKNNESKRHEEDEIRARLQPQIRNGMPPQMRDQMPQQMRDQMQRDQMQQQMQHTPQMQREQMPPQMQHTRRTHDAATVVEVEAPAELNASQELKKETRLTAQDMRKQPEGVVKDAAKDKTEDDEINSILNRFGIFQNANPEATPDDTQDTPQSQTEAKLIDKLNETSDIITD